MIFQTAFELRAQDGVIETPKQTQIENSILAKIARYVCSVRQVRE